MAEPTLTTIQAVEAWGNGLALRLTQPMVKALKLAEGVAVVIEIRGETLLVRSKPREAKLTLEQKLAQFDPSKFGGEVMSSGRAGTEIW